MNRAVAQSTATFGPFTLIPARQLLLDGGAPVRLGSRAMSLLCALVEQAGAVLSRDELVGTVWPTTVVEETSLRVQVAALRKVLGEGQRGERYIANVVGRGYSFVAPVTWRHQPHAADEPAQTQVRHNLPTRLTRAIGRDELIDSLRAQLSRRRLLSIVGPGGIGKTTVALAVAEKALTSFEHGVFFVDLAPLTDSQTVAKELLAILVVSAAPGDAVPALRAFLRERRMLLIFDNCEHLVDAVARLAHDLVGACPELHVLTTSREPLNVEGEWVHRQAALTTPDAATQLTVAQAFDYPAVRLFVERATANSETFALTAANLNAVRQVCCRLEGMPLAIELAAGRTQSLGVQGLADRLDGLFDVLTRGRRPADLRHRALSAVLDWSHKLLSEGERTVLRRLSIFRAAFTLEAASHVAADEQLSASAVVEHLLGLVDKSLVTANANNDVVHYRLLFATRKFAEMQLSSSGETELLARRHALHFRDELVARRSAPSDPGTAEQIAFHELTRADLDGAIEWALDGPETRGIGVQLVLASEAAGEWAFVDSRLARVERALGHVTRLDPPQTDTEAELTCHWCSLSGMSNALGLNPDKLTQRLLTLTVDLARENLPDCFRSMAIGAFGQGDYLSSTGHAESLAAYGDLPMVARQAERMLALNHHFMGRQREAGELAQALVDEVLTAARAPWIAAARRSFSMRLVMARILWVQGRADQAAAMSAAAVEDSLQAHRFARCMALGLAAVPVALWRGDLDTAETATRQLHDLTVRHALGYWQPWVDHFDKIILARRAAEPVAIAPGDAAAPDLLARNPTELDALPTFAEELLTEAALARVEQGGLAGALQRPCASTASPCCAMGCSQKQKPSSIDPSNWRAAKVPCRGSFERHAVSPVCGTGRVVSKTRRHFSVRPMRVSPRGTGRPILSPHESCSTRSAPLRISF